MSEFLIALLKFYNRKCTDFELFRNIYHNFNDFKNLNKINCFLFKNDNTKIIEINLNENFKVLINEDLHLITFFNIKTLFYYFKIDYLFSKLIVNNCKDFNKSLYLFINNNYKLSEKLNS